MPLSPKGGYLFLCYQLLLSIQPHWRRMLVLLQRYLFSCPSLNHSGLKRNRFRNTIEPSANPIPTNIIGRIAALSFAIKNTMITIIADVESKKPMIMAIFFVILIGFCFSFCDQCINFFFGQVFTIIRTQLHHRRITAGT